MSEAPRKIRILFIDDDKGIVEGLQRSMHSMRAQWEVTFACSGPEALALMAKAAPDVVICDMRMPGMNGRDVLMEVKRLYPQTIRIILSGYAQPASIMEVAGAAHQYLSKPCDIGVIKTAISRTVGLRALLDDEGLIQRIGSIDSLPSLPSTYQKVVSHLQGPDPNVAHVGRIISADIVMTSVILKLANSGFFGSRQKFLSADRAVAYLGLETVAGLVLVHSLFTDHLPKDKSGLNLARILQHSLQTAACIKALARFEGWPGPRTEEAVLAGMVHDLGKLVLATRASVAQQSISADEPLEADDEHGAVGAYLLGLWGFPDTLIEAVAYHHTPLRTGATEIDLTGLLHVADRLAHGPAGSLACPMLECFEAGFLESIGALDRVADWQRVCEQSTVEASDKPTTGNRPFSG